MIPALAFVPEEKGLEYFNELVERECNTENEELDEKQNEENKKLEILVAYFEDNYIVRIVRKFKSQLYLTLKIAEKYTNAVFVVVKGLVNDMILDIEILQMLSENINLQN
jgi:hypothetical protein